MKVRLLRDARINHNAGEIVEVSPVIYDFLVTTNTAEPVAVEAPQEEKPKRRTTTKKG